jgi:hypothetical protein
MLCSSFNGQIKQKSLLAQKETGKLAAFLVLMQSSQAEGVNRK